MEIVVDVRRFAEIGFEAVRDFESKGLPSDSGIHIQMSFAKDSCTAASKRIGGEL